MQALKISGAAVLAASTISFITVGAIKIRDSPDDKLVGGSLLAAGIIELYMCLMFTCFYYILSEKITPYPQRGGALDPADECCICCETLGETQAKPIHRIPECQHAFHASCINAWLEIKQTCPLCKVEVRN
jgi:hypothetical protein